MGDAMTERSFVFDDSDNLSAIKWWVEDADKYGLAASIVIGDGNGMVNLDFHAVNAEEAAYMLESVTNIRLGLDAFERSIREQLKLCADLVSGWDAEE